VKLTDVLDILGVVSLAVFAFLIWPPLVFAVIGVILLVASFVRARGGRS
jgi:hypothetical protein